MDTADTYSSHQAMALAQPIRFALCVLLIAAFGFGLLLLLIWYLTSRHARLEIGNGRVIWSKGLLRKDRVELSIASIRSVRVNQDLIDRFTGIGEVLLVSAGDRPEVVAPNMPDVERIRRLLTRSS